ncbi:MAG: hypothetical protein B7Z11_00175 [Acidovorax sp. 32-64-7]|nr:MAG: hypothetical protein B7Z11_00175 [Acidovorax sp. 32-64-7]
MFSSGVLIIRFHRVVGNFVGVTYFPTANRVGMLWLNIATVSAQLHFARAIKFALARQLIILHDLFTRDGAGRIMFNKTNLSPYPVERLRGKGCSHGCTCK